MHLSQKFCEAYATIVLHSKVIVMGPSQISILPNQEAASQTFASKQEAQLRHRKEQKRLELNIILHATTE